MAQTNVSCIIIVLLELKLVTDLRLVFIYLLWEILYGETKIYLYIYNNFNRRNHFLLQILNAISIIIENYFSYRIQPFYFELYQMRIFWRKTLFCRKNKFIRFN